MKYKSANILQRGFSFAIVCLAAGVFEYYFSLSHDLLIPLTAIFVMITPVGNSIYHGIKRLLLILLIVMVGSLILQSYHALYARLYDVCIGAIIGIIVNLVVFPRQVDRAFRLAILPILNAYKTYFIAVMDSLFKKEEESSIQKILLETELQHFPHWVYARGFDAGLKKGHQYFVMKMYHVAEILFALQHAARCSFDEEIYQAMHEPLSRCTTQITGYFDALISVFELKKITGGIDVEEAARLLRELDEKFKSLLPKQLGWLDMAREDIAFYAVLTVLDDLQQALIKLGEAVRGEKTLLPTSLSPH